MKLLLLSKNKYIQSDQVEIILKKEPAITIDKVLIIDLNRNNKDIKIELKSAYWMGTHANAVRCLAFEFRSY